MRKRKHAKAALAAISAAALLAAGAAGTVVAEETVPQGAVVLGNVDMSADGKVDAADALLALQASTGKVTLTTDQIKAANVNGSVDKETGAPTVTPEDALLILQYATQKISQFPCESETPVRTSGNPIFTDIFTADPSAHVWDDGRLYVYPSQDQFPAKGCDFMDKYHVYSTTNMVDWYDHGQILSSDDVEWGRPEGGFMWAPDAAYKDGKYYFFFPHPSDTAWNASWKIGVAVSDKPAEDFEVVTEKPDGTPYKGYMESIPYDEYGYGLIDPCVFQDPKDGKFYMSVGGAGHCYIAEMTEDMLDIVPETWTEVTDDLKYPGSDRIDRGDGTDYRDFHEGSWIFERDGKYYLMYPDGHDPSDDGREGGNEMRYAIADNVMGPYTAQPDPILGPVLDCDTTHGSIVEYKGEWYIFYHNSALSGAGNLRSACVDKVYFNEDGTIKPVVQTEAGVPAIGPAETGTYAPNQTGALVIGEDTIDGYKQTYTHGYDYNLNFAKVDVDMSKVPDDKCQKDDAGNLILDGNGNRIPKEMPRIEGAGATRHTVMLTAAGAYLQFDGVIGGKTDGKALLEVHYAAADKPNFQVRTTGMAGGLNATTSYYMRMASTGAWDDYSGVAYCLIDLKAGADNAVWLATGAGGANFTGIRVYLPEGNVDPTLVPKDPTVVDYSVYTGPATEYTLQDAQVGTTADGAQPPVLEADGTLHNMERAGAYVDIPHINGGKGGKAMVTVSYAAANAGSSTVSANGTKLKLGGDMGFEATGGWSDYTGAMIGLVELQAGTDNVIRVTGGSGGFNVDTITVTLLPQD